MNAVLVASSLTTLVAVSGLIAIASRDHRCECATSQLVVAEGPNLQYASSVRSFSSEYSAASWSAQQALGAPNVYPRAGDIEGAWASREPDASSEFIELGFAQPMRASALLVYETFNPGAIASIELITERGAHISVPRSSHERSGGAAVSTFGTTCTGERIAAVRISLSSGNVAGWNEIDAVALMPCQ